MDSLFLREREREREKERERERATVKSTQYSPLIEPNLKSTNFSFNPNFLTFEISDVAELMVYDVLNAKNLAFRTPDV